MKTFYRKLLYGVLGTVVGVLILYYFGIAKHLSLANIKTWAGSLQAQVQEHYISSVFTFIVICTTLIAFTLPITGPMGIVAGFVFGFLPGVTYSMISILVGTTISFLVIRHALSHIVRSQYREKLDEFNYRIRKYGYTYLISLQLLTVVPYFVINTLAALAGVSLRMFLLTTIIGSLPIMIIYTLAGQELYHLQSWRDIVSFHMLSLLILLAVLAMLPMVVRKFFPKREDDQDPNIWLD